MKSMLQLFATLACALALTACGGGNNNDTTPTIPAQPAYSATDTVVGTGIEAIAGDQLTVNYTGWLYDSTAADKKGKMFDTSRDLSPFTFTLGKGTVIGGWEKGILGMKAGGKRTLVIPQDLAYGAAGAPAGRLGVAIPTYAPLIFEVELISIKR
jgi:FKBP-type peptidyl-prolyl cis-trans isomerase FkpA